MTKLTGLAVLGLVLIIIYSIGATMWIICPQVLIRWADYFGIKIEDKPLEPLFEDEVEEKQIEVEKIRRRKHESQRSREQDSE